MFARFLETQRAQRAQRKGISRPHSAMPPRALRSLRFLDWSRLGCALKSVVAILVVLGWLIGGSAVRANEDLYRKVAPATALVFKNEGPFLGGAGTGFLIDAKERLVITARHVVEKAMGGGVVPAVVVIFAQSNEGEIITESDYYRKQRSTLEVRGKVIYDNVRRDMAVIQVDKLPAGVKPLKLAPQRARPGQTVHLIGNSTDPEGGVFGYCQGYVRNVFRYEMMGASVVATQAPANKGDSGGPMFNNSGEIIGFASMSILKGPLTLQGAPGDAIQLLQLGVCVTEIRDGLQEMRERQKAVSFQGEAKVSAHHVMMEKDALYRIVVKGNGFVPDLHVDNFVINPLPSAAPFSIQDAQYLYTPRETKEHRIQVGHLPGRDLAKQAFPYTLTVDRVAFEPDATLKEQKLKLNEHASKLEAGKLYNITVRGKGFEPDLQVIDSGKIVATRFSTGQAVKSGWAQALGFGKAEYETSLAWMPPRTAEFRIMVAVGPFSKAAAGPLDYTLQIAEQKIDFSVRDQLTATDPLYPQAGPFKVHKVKLEAGKNYQIDMFTTAFDSRLVLEDAAGKVVMQGFDSDGYNARLVFRPTKSDTFRVVCTAHQIDAAGAYLLTVVDNPQAQPGPVRFGTKGLPGAK